MLCKNLQIVERHTLLNVEVSQVEAICTEEKKELSKYKHDVAIVLIQFSHNFNSQVGMFFLGYTYYRNRI